MGGQTRAVLTIPDTELSFEITPRITADNITEKVREGKYCVSKSRKMKNRKLANLDNLEIVIIVSFPHDTNIYINICLKLSVLLL